MEEYATAHPMVSDDVAPRAPWTARLEVFEQDFDTAMAIWSVEDAVVGRLCADEQPVTRRRTNLSTSQVEFSQLSQFSQREASQRSSRSKKRRRKVTENEGYDGPDAPLPPFSQSTEVAEATQDLSATQVLMMESAGPTQGLSMTESAATQVVGEGELSSLSDRASDDRETSSSCTPSKYDGSRAFTTPTPGPRTSSAEWKSGEQVSSFSQADVVRESPLDSFATTYPARAMTRVTVDGDARTCSAFSTGSGKTLTVSRKRMRGVETSWSTVERSLETEDEVSYPREGQARLSQAGKDVHSSRVVVPDVTRQDAPTVPAIDPMRLSFSTTQDCDDINDGASRGLGFQTGSGRTLRPSRESLSRYEALLFGDEASAVRSHGETKSLNLAMQQEGETDTVRLEVSSTHTQGSTSCDAQAPLLGRECALQEETCSQTAMTGFQTGAGRQVAVSRDRLSKYSLTLFDENEEKPSFTSSITTKSVDHHRVQSPPRFAGTLQQEATSATAMTGFQTGAGRQVAVSRDRLFEYSVALFDENEEKPSFTSSITTKSVDHPRVQSSPPESRSIPGFQTASGRAVEISEERLKEMEARLFLEDGTNGGMNRSNKADDTTPTGNGVSLRSNTGSPSNGLGLSSTLRVQRSSRGIDTPRIPSGFQTGSGGRVHISPERLREYEQKVFTEGQAGAGARDAVDNVGMVCEEPPTMAILSGFSTASGGQVSVSKERLQLYEKKLQEDDGVVSSTVEAPRDRTDRADHSIGFATARGQKVVVSEEKVRQYAQKFDEDEASDVPPMRTVHQRPSVDPSSEVIGGFTTGTGRHVVISAEKLREYQEKLKDSEGDPDRVEREGRSEHLSCRKDDFSSQSRPQSAETASTALPHHCALVPENILPEHQVKVSATADESSNYLKNLRSDQHEKKITTESFQTDGQGLEGRPPRHRHSIGAPTSSSTADLKIRRHSLPPRGVQTAPDKGSAGVSSGVMHRMTVSLQRNKPSVLDDVSNTLKSRSRVSGLNGGGKWKPPSQLQGSQSGGYSTPAKTRAPAPQSLSGKKGFRPPVPLKTPPSKSLQIISPQKPADTSALDRAPEIKMRYREAMRISYRLLALEVEKDAHSFTSQTRATLLRHIEPERALGVVFSEIDGELLPPGGEEAGVSLLDLYEEMKERGYIGTEAGVTWFRNQYRWVLWKLATLELMSPRFLFGRYLTKGQVMFEICKRYERDIVLAQRSVLKKILNRDANAATCMILRVAAVLPYPVGEEKDVDIIPPPHWKLAVVLTDGWHGVYAVPDSHLAEAFWKHHQAGRLVGRKVVTWSATLQNINDGIDPLECSLATEDKWGNPLWAGKDDPSKWPYLKLQFNSTRPVAADARLGLESLVRPAKGKQSDAPYDFVMLKSVPMRSLEVGGGIVRSVCVRVIRISPILHLQAKDFSIGPRILCEEHMPQYFQARQEYVQDQSADDTNDDDQSSLPLPVPFVKLEVECAHEQDPSRRCYAVLTVWRPGDEMLSKFKEGAKYFVSSLSVSWKVDYGRLGVFMRVGTTKGSAFDPAEVSQGEGAKPRGRVCESVETLIQRYQQHVETMPKEKKLLTDVCVVVLRCEEEKMPLARPPGTSSATSVQHVFVTDRSCRLMSIRIQSMRVFKSSSRADHVSARKKTPERLFTRGNKKVWSEGSVVCINGLEVSHFDERLGILDCDLVESSQILSLPSKKSHFFEDAQALRALLGRSDHELTVSFDGLRKHIDRTILHLEVPSSQEDDDAGGLVHVEDEAEHLTQDLQAVPEDDVNFWMSQAHVIHAVGTVVRILPLDTADPLANDVCSVAAIAYIRSSSSEDEEDAVQALYLPRGVLEETQVLLSRDLDKCTLTFEGDSSISNCVLRFEAQWETSERLLNSWKPWERDSGATFLLASSVSRGV